MGASAPLSPDPIRIGNPQGAIGSGVKQVTDRVARYLVRTILAGPLQKK